jgi:hypothetical protein
MFDEIVVEELVKQSPILKHNLNKFTPIMVNMSCMDVLNFIHGKIGHNEAYYRVFDGTQGIN